MKRIVQILLILSMTLSIYGIGMSTKDSLSITDSTMFITTRGFDTDSLFKVTQYGLKSYMNSNSGEQIHDSLGQSLVVIPNDMRIKGDVYSHSSSTNTIFGITAGDILIGTANTLFGYRAGKHLTTVYYNTMVGTEAGYTVNGSSNTLFGYRAGRNGTSANNNVFIGYQAGDLNTTGDNNIAIGYNVDASSATTSYGLNIGDLITGDLNGTDKYIKVDGFMQGGGANADLFIAYIDTTVYIVSKYNDNLDLISRWKGYGANNLYSFYDVGLVANTTNILTQAPESATFDTTFISNNISDCFPAPIYIADVVTLRSGWTGGSHQNGTYDTAYTDSYDILVNGQSISTGFRGYANEVKIITHNILYNPYILPTKHKLIDEYVSFNVTKNTIEVSLQHDTDSTFTAYNYYGMQCSQLSTEWKDSLYIAHSDNNIWLDFNTADSSGYIDDYPNVEKAVWKNNDRSMTLIMWIDNNYGLPSDPNTYIKDTSTTDKFIFPSNLKGYFRQITDYDVAGSEKWEFRGSYSFQDQSSITDNDIITAGTFTIDAKPIMYADIKKTVEVTVPKEFRGKRLNRIKSDSIRIDYNVFPKLMDITANGYGNVYLDYTGYDNDITIVNQSAYTVKANDKFLLVTFCNTGAVTITIPSKLITQNFELIIKDNGNATTNSITITTEGSETIDGSATYILSSNYDAIGLKVISNNLYVY